MGTKLSFEKHADVNSVQITGPDGKEIRLEDGVYTTDDPTVINDLAGHPHVKAADTSAKGKS